MLPQVGRILILFGVVAVLLGAVLLLAGKSPLIGKLPGDILIKKKPFSFHFPSGTSRLLSLVLSLAVALFGHLFHK
ncbi:MAG: hypothetical protein A2142_05500 [candidate division Zixibacteria bacterium RBG_16_48_11]|nr:MAG: hypothetical protein A2142_05500 [candidate division Zixibacteria bacterium RBG_16_48_11]